MCFLIPAYIYPSPRPLRLAPDGTGCSIMEAFVVADSVSDKTFKLKFKLQQLASNFGDLYEQLFTL